ncbi:MAG TPA: hypothetical protein VFC61_03495 [Blastocatellia bacterium]|nr:hypothetical protein [Blastocatellia bacterium]
MKRRALVAGMSILIVCAAVAFGQRPREGAKGEPAAETQWEYLIISGGTSNLTSFGSGSSGGASKQPDGSFNREALALERNMDKLGARGWELVAVSGHPNDPVFYLKRPKEAGR